MWQDTRADPGAAATPRRGAPGGLGLRGKGATMSP